MSSKLIKEFISFMEHDPTSLKFGGFSSSLVAYVVSESLINSNHNFLIVTGSTQASSALHQDLKTFLASSTKNNLDILDYFSGWETSPYLSYTPSIKTRMRRARVLSKIVNRTSRCIVTDIESLSQKTPSISSFKNKIFSIHRGGHYPREELLEFLHCAGFQQRDPVEDPGTFTFRGGLLDLFSTSRSKPVRIDFFGDEIESIREYDSSTQKSIDTYLDKLEIYPAYEWVLDESNIQYGKTAIKTYCDDHGISKGARDRIFEGLDLGIVDPTLEYLFPFFYKNESVSWLGDWIDSSWRVLYYNADEIDSAFYEKLSARKTEYKKSLENKSITASFDQLFIDSDTYKNFNLKKLNCELNELSFGVESEDPIEENENLPLLKENARLSNIKNNGFSDNNLKNFYELAEVWQKNNYTRFLFATTASQADRIRYLLEQHGLRSSLCSNLNPSNSNEFQIIVGSLSSGFRIPRLKLAILTDSEIFGNKKIRSKTIQESDTPEIGKWVSSLDDLDPQDHVVHQIHGIGKYIGMIKLEIEKIPQDFLLLEYANNDKLYLPIYRLDQIQKYIGSDAAASLGRLGTDRFIKTKEEVKKELKEIAHELLVLYANRSSHTRLPYAPPDELFRAFEARFPFPETPDQNKAIDDISRDLSGEKIMDRLVCGDVGYGKTEVAMRAAYRAVLDSKQVAVLVPTTVLALQHERSFTERFKDTPVRVTSASRFKSTKEVKQILENNKNGAVDILIGTHRLLSSDVQFKNLGLLIIDEEQRFGVEAKEKIKKIKFHTDVLTLTATPIPRTLQMSMLGLRDISLINTAPIDRLSVRTYIAKLNDEVIRRSIEPELARGGQVFFIHNRVQTIYSMSDRIRNILPKARIIVAHGQMPEKELENAMLSFYNKEADVLVCSAIIESGLDIPNANTIIINRADCFGLAQLYQLRGRVGRSTSRAYCYLLLPEEGDITVDAKKRLDIIQRFVELGSGFKIASHDLELRGGGDLLGKTQSGHIAEVGYEMFMELLEETIEEIKGKEPKDRFDPEIKIPAPTLLSESYIPDLHQRVHYYKRLSECATPEELHQTELDLQDRYGKLPEETQNLLWLIRTKQLLKTHHIQTLIAGKERVSLEGTPKSNLSPLKIMALVKKSPNKYQLTPESKMIFKHHFDTAQGLFNEVQNFLSQVAEQ